MKIFKQGVFEGERALYNIRGAKISDSVFQNGESPLKECDGIELFSSIFKWKYPLWYSKNISVDSCVLLETARSGIWYTENIELKNTVIEAPKTFRRSSGITLTSCSMPNALESFWSCSDIKITNLSARGDYMFMNSCGVVAENLTLDGNYAFDGARDVVVRNSKLISKDAFWNTENVTVYDSVIIGEYLGWNSKNVRFVNCTIESNQGLCYMENLELVNCKLINTDLAFELSSVSADVKSSIISVKNPISGKIHAEKIGEIILDENMIDPEKTEITTDL